MTQTNMPARAGFVSWRRVAAAALLAWLAFLPACRKSEDTVQGEWQGTLQLTLSHEHEEYIQWTEYGSDGAPPIIHTEHVSWSFSDRIAIALQFSVDAAFLNSPVTGSGDATQDPAFIPTGDLRLASLTAPGFDVKLFGTIGTASMFSLRVVPESLPALDVAVASDNPHIHVRVPEYGAYLLSVLNNIDLQIPALDGASIGGSGVQEVGDGGRPMAYIFTLRIARP